MFSCIDRKVKEEIFINSQLSEFLLYVFMVSDSWHKGSAMCLPPGVWWWTRK